MTIPPVVHEDELRETLNRIAQRHQDIDDQAFALIDCEDAYAVFTHLRRRPTRVEEVDTRDVLDVQILQDWLWHDLRRGEHTFLTRGETIGIPLTRLGSRWGISGQGVRDRIDAGHALITYGHSTVHLTREARRAAIRTTDGTNPQDLWLVTHRDRIRAVAEELLTLRRVASPAARTWIDEVESDYEDDEWSRESPVIMSLAWSYLRTQPEFYNKAPQHHVQVIGRKVEALRRDFDNAAAEQRKPSARRKPPGRRRRTPRSGGAHGRKGKRAANPAA